MQEGPRTAWRLELNPTLGIPLYRQIVDGIKELVAVGTLRPGDQLPSIRELATQLRINPSSAVKAYGELRHDGIIDLEHGRGTFVREDASAGVRSREALLRREVEALVARAHTLGFTDEQLTAAVAARLKAGRR